MAGEGYSINNKSFSEENAKLYIYKLENNKKEQNSSVFKKRVKSKLVKAFGDWNSLIEGKPYLSSFKITSRLLRKKNLPSNINPEYLLLSYNWIARYQAEKPRAYDLAGESYQSWEFNHKLFSSFKGFDKLNSTVNLGNYSYKLIYSKGALQIWQLVK